MRANELSAGRQLTSAVAEIAGRIAAAEPYGTDEVRVSLDSGPTLQLPQATYHGLAAMFGDRLGEVGLRFRTGWLSRLSQQTTLMTLPAWLDTRLRPGA